MLANRSMPSSTVIPQLPYVSVVSASEWLVCAFGFTVRVQIADHRIQMNVGSGHVILTQASELPARCSVMVRVEDVDAHHARSVKAGAQVVSPPQTQPYGERQYTAIDCDGHAWTFSQSLADVAPESWGGKAAQL